MYERTARGMGWSALDPMDWDWWVYSGFCNSGYGNRTREVCFTDGEEGTAHHVGCVRHGRSCTTEQGNEGHFWCCPEGYPRPYQVSPERQLYVDQQQQAQQQDQEPSEEPGQAPALPPTATPRPVHTRSFVEKLSHPGALAAMGVLGAGLTFLYLSKRREWRLF